MYRLYNTLLIGSAVAAVLGFGLYGRTLEPLTGDLTRIGWYSENEFGWTVPQRRFQSLVAAVGELGFRADIIAYGDSFTAESPHNPGVTWPHFLARDTGLSVGIVDRGLVPIDELLGSAAWRDHPPSILIYELVERSLVPEHGRSGTAGDPCTARIPTPDLTFDIAPLSIEPIAVARPTRRGWDEWPAAYAINFVFQNAIRAVEGHETTNAVRLEMMRPGLFSSAGDRSLLVYGTDFNKMSWTAAEWQAAACDLLRLQDHVQANGRTVFVAMIVPDKLSVYAKFLQTREFDRLSQLERLAEVPSLNLVPLAAALDPVAHIDLYLPNDTHWSSATQAIAARQIRRMLEARGLFRPRDQPTSPAVTSRE
jgi:hypothetical protein